MTYEVLTNNCNIYFILNYFYNVCLELRRNLTPEKNLLGHYEFGNISNIRTDI